MHIGSSEGITLLKFNEEVEEHQEAPQPVALEGEEQALEDQPECPDHRPTSFSQRQAPEHFKSPMLYKISLEFFMFDALGYKS